jgi:post-segregation antitoxin (ccd killing protein)
LADLESRWLQDNREAIEHYNRRICEHGLLVDEAGLL